MTWMWPASGCIIPFTELPFTTSPTPIPVPTVMYADGNTLEFWVVLIIEFFVLYGWIILAILVILACFSQDRTGKPTFSSPNEITALIMVALAKNEGYLTVDKSQMLIKNFKRVFSLDDKESFILLTSSLFTQIVTFDGLSSAFQNEVIDTFKSCFHHFRLRNSG